MKRVGNSFKGILGGFVFIIIGVVLLWWNEGNNVRNLKTTAEMDKSFVDVSSESVDPQNEGKLIATYGKLVNEEEMTDETFGVTVKTPLLRRTVEVYQWDETSNTDEDGDTTYSYSKKWSSDLIDSSNFHQSGHDNPTVKLVEDAEYTSSDVKVGAFTLASNQVERLSTNGNYTDFNAEKAAEGNYTISGNYLTTAADINSPEIGDTRISFVYNNSTDVSVLAVQKGSTFVDFVSKAGKTHNVVEDGVHSGSEMINDIKAANNMLKWILRAAGIIAIILGFATILKPLSAITSYVPILGGLVSSAVGLVALILGLCVGLVVIALAWIRFRPLVGIGLLVVVGALAFFLITKGKKSKAQEPTSTTPQETQPVETAQEVQPVETVQEEPNQNDQQ